MFPYRMVYAFDKENVYTEVIYCYHDSIESAYTLGIEAIKKAHGDILDKVIGLSFLKVEGAQDAN